MRDALPCREQRIEAPQLSEPERGAHLVETIVVAKTHVAQPGGIVVAALIAQALQEPRTLRIRRDDHPALAGRHLLVGIESEHRRRTERARTLTVMRRADRLARIFDDGEIVTGGRVDERLIAAG